MKEKDDQMMKMMTTNYVILLTSVRSPHVINNRAYFTNIGAGAEWSGTELVAVGGNYNFL